MKESRDSNPFEKHAFAIAAGFCGAFFAVWLLDYSLLRADWCSEPKAECFREWIGATSGWAAAIVAVVAAAVTLGPLRRQVAEAQRQTDYAVGDAEPEFTLTRHRNQNIIRLRVTNWNRRPIAIDNVDLYTAQIKKWPIAVDGYLLSGRPGRHKYFPVFIVRGWIDRNKSPPIRNVNLLFDDRIHGLDLHISLRGELRAAIRYRQIGQTHRRMSADALAVELD